MTYNLCACVMSESEVIELDADEMRFLYHNKDKNSGSYEMQNIKIIEKNNFFYIMQQFNIGSYKTFYY